MKLHVKRSAPSVVRVQIFLDECGRSLEEVEVADSRSPAFLAINPFGTVPVLETDSGEMIAESLTICRFLDRQWETGLFGDSPAERLSVELWERRSELLLYLPAIEYVHQLHPTLAGEHQRHPAWARVLAGRVERALKIFDARLQESCFLAGETFTIADITTFLGVSAFAAFGAVDLGPLEALGHWRDTVGARRSMRRLRSLAI